MLHSLRSETYAATGTLGWSKLAFRVTDHLVALGYARKPKNGMYSITAAGCRVLKIAWNKPALFGD